MTVPVDPGIALQDNNDEPILLSGSTGLHERFTRLYDMFQSGIGPDNLDLNQISLLGLLGMSQMMTPFWANNLSFRKATTTNANDSIKLTSGDGTALSVNNPGYLYIPEYFSPSRSDFRKFTITSDITMLVSGAHWGIDGTGDVTGAILRIGFAITNLATLTLAVAYVGSPAFPAPQNTRTCNATPSSINKPEYVLVSSSIGNGQFFECGYALANFTDATNVWSIGDPIMGQTAHGLWQPWNPALTGFSSISNTGNPRWSQMNDIIFVSLYNIGGTSNATGFTITLPVIAKAESQHLIRVRDDGVISNSPGLATTTAVSNILTLYKNLDLTVFTNANGKNADINLWYRAYL